MSLKLIAIGAFGRMLGPSAKHLLHSDVAHYVRVHDRGTNSAFHTEYRSAWQMHGANLVADFDALVGDGDFDGVVICAGKNAQDYQIIKDLVPLLTTASKKTHKKYFILHLSTVTCRFVEVMTCFCQTEKIDYVNYPLTGGSVGAAQAKMLILACGEMALYERLKPMLECVGVSKYFGSDPTLGAATKLIGHIQVFHNLLGGSLAVLLHTKLMGSSELGSAQVEFFDFLNQGAGGHKQWDVTLRRTIVDSDWETGFLLPHALVDVIYTMDLMLSKNIAPILLLPLAEVALLFCYLARKKPGKVWASQSILYALLHEDNQEITAFIQQYLRPDQLLQSCLQAMPDVLRESVMLDV